MLMSLQDVHCNACGTLFSTDFHSFGGKVCSMECHKELEWKHTLSILGKPYRERTKEVA